MWGAARGAGEGRGGVSGARACRKARPGPGEGVETWRVAAGEGGADRAESQGAGPGGGGGAWRRERPESKCEEWRSMGAEPAARRGAEPRVGAGESRGGAGGAGGRSGRSRKKGAGGWRRRRSGRSCRTAGGGGGGGGVCAGHMVEAPSPVSCPARRRALPQEAAALRCCRVARRSRPRPVPMRRAREPHRRQPRAAR